MWKGPWKLLRGQYALNPPDPIHPSPANNIRPYLNLTHPNQPNNKSKSHLNLTQHQKYPSKKIIQSIFGCQSNLQDLTQTKEVMSGNTGVRTQNLTQAFTAISIRSMGNVQVFEELWEKYSQ
jgi:uncharacterized protein YegL